MTNVIVPGVIAGFVAIIGILLGWWVKRNDDKVKRNDEAVRLTQQSMKVIARDFALFNALKLDFWDLERWANDAKNEFAQSQRDCINEIKRLHALLREKGLIDSLPDMPAARELPAIPPSRMAKMQLRLDAGLDDFGDGA